MRKPVTRCKFFNIIWQEGQTWKQTHCNSVTASNVAAADPLKLKRAASKKKKKDNTNGSAGADGDVAGVFNLTKVADLLPFIKAQI